MRKLLVTLACIAAVGPRPVHAQPFLPEVADPAASMPTVTMPAAFAGYHPYDDRGPGSWTDLNHALVPRPRPHARPASVSGVHAVNAPASHDPAAHWEHQ